MNSEKAIVEPLVWPRELRAFSQRWSLAAEWLGTGTIFVLSLILAFLHTMWWLLLCLVCILVGPNLFYALESRRLRRVYECIEEQLARRGDIFSEMWAGDPGRADVAQQVVNRSTWRHKAFGPDDPLVIVLYDHATFDTNEMAMFAAEDVLGQEISYECSEELLEMTLGQAVDYLLSKKGTT